MPEKGEKVKIRGLKGQFEFVRFGKDKGGDYAVVLGGLKGHRLERIVKIDRLILARKKTKRRRVTTLNVVDV